MTKKKVLKTLIVLREFIEKDSTKERYKIGEKSFERNTKINFIETSLFFLNKIDKTLQIEINNFLKNMDIKEEPYSKSAMSKARKKISPELFKGINDELLKEFYKDKKEVKLFIDFRLICANGSTIEIPNNIIAKDIKQSKELREIYGSNQPTILKNHILARGSLLYDLLNNIIIEGELSTIHSNERFMLIDHLESFKKKNEEIKSKYKDLFIYDKGYTSLGLIGYHKKNNLDFLMRVQDNSFKALEKFKRSKKVDEIIEIEASKEVLKDLSKAENHPKLREIKEEFQEGDTIKVRAVKVVLDNKEVEVLLTSLSSKKKYPTNIFKDLYFKRWKTEKDYDILQNVFKIENWSGLTQLAINQDFFATILTGNITSLILQTIMDEKERKKL